MKVVSNAVSVCATDRQRNLPDTSVFDTPRMTVNISAFDYHDLSKPPPFSTISALPDTGANKTLISSQVLDTMQIPYNSPSNTRKHKIIAANNTSLKFTGTFYLLLFFEGKTFPIHALVCSDLHEDLLISWKDLQRIGSISRDFPYTDSLLRPCQAKTSTSVDSIDTLLAEFSDVFSDEAITPMQGAPMHVHIRRTDPAYKPLKIKTARKTPKHFQKEAEKLIKQLLDSGVIVKVPTTENVEWCSPGFFVPKPNGKVRLVTDYRQINTFIDRPVHPFPSCRNILRGLKPDSKWFLKFDAIQGYFQIKLDDESSRLTTFLVESGRYRFTRAPMGLSPSSDYFCERSDLAFATVPDLLKIVDDGLLQAPTKPVHFVTYLSAAANIIYH